MEEFAKLADAAHGELKSITLGQVHLEETPPYIELRAANQKARRGAQNPLPASKEKDAKTGEEVLVKTDTNGRTLGIHALRHSYCTLVTRSGVNMQHAPRLMRHATPAMTMGLRPDRGRAEEPWGEAFRYGHRRHTAEARH